MCKTPPKHPWKIIMKTLVLAIMGIESFPKVTFYFLAHLIVWDIIYIK